MQRITLQPMSLYEFTDSDCCTDFQVSTDANATEWDSGRLTVELDATDLRRIRTLALQRYKSSGGTHIRRDQNASDLDIHKRGIKAEYALAKAYHDAEVDTEIYEDSGDGGVDSTLSLGGERLDVDIKSSQYAPPWVKVETGAAAVNTPDAYVAAHVDGSTITFYGWVTTDDVIDEDNRRKSRARHSNHENYTVEGDYDAMPRPDVEVVSATTASATPSPNSADATASAGVSKWSFSD